MPITTLLFDCDNTLVLSEDLAFEACAEQLNAICADHNVTVSFTGSMLMKEFVGQNFRGMLAALQKQHAFALSPEETERYVAREEDAVIAKLRASLRACPGVDDQLARLASQNKYTLAVVSSSAKRRVVASLAKVGQDRYFPDDVVFSAASSLATPTSKPDPAIYLHALEKLGKKASEAVAIEDSKSGTLSATRAGIKCIGYVGPYPDDRKAKMEAVLTDAGAVALMRDWSQFPGCLELVESIES